MRIVLTGRQIELTPSLKEFAEKKLDSLASYVDHIDEIDAILSVAQTKSQGTLHTAEVTVWAKGINFRASQSHKDMYAAIDLILDKLTKQITRYKDKRKKKPYRKHKKDQLAFTHAVFEFDEDLLTTQEEQHKEANTKPTIIRSNNFSSKPMFIDEAAEQLQLLQQDFVIFNNADSDSLSVVYKRSDGNIGLIEANPS
ncbi:MAG: ribosomal subunit interface protein [Candidatus Cloacimonadota bacterium]|nr:MAG: ribosomal subunit interface protein [Candidatus Cloacimonadota bacterium]